MNSQPVSRLRFWLTTQICGLAFFAVMGLLGMLVEASDAGCMYVTPALFMVLAVLYPVARLRRFGAATAVFLLYVTVGSYIEYQMQWVVERQLASPWGAFAWGLLGMLVGWVADVTFHFLPPALPPIWRGMITGVATAVAFFATTYVAMTTLYVSPASQQTHFVFFSSRAVFSLTWMILNGGAAGYLAMALAEGFGVRAQGQLAAT
jgi:hypothetical protein